MKFINTLLLLSVFVVCYGGAKLTTTQKFKSKIKGADKIVVRDGGDICCASAQKTLKQPVYFTITDPKEIKEVFDNLNFRGGIVENNCMCCGYPGIDWYKNGKRICLSASKHGDGLMIKGQIWRFSAKSKVWLAKWLLKHKFPDKYKEIRKIVGKSKKNK